MSISKFQEIAQNTEVDIAIIGAGISGLYCAYRLITHPLFKDKKIAIYERLNRTGGRLQTDLIPIQEEHAVSQTDGAIPQPVPTDIVKEEEGAMRFNYDMIELMSLNKQLGLCNEFIPFPMSSKGNTNRFHIRGKGFSVAEANAGGNMIWSQLYDLDPREVGLSPTQIVANAYHRILENNDVLMTEKQTPEYWQKFRLEFTWNDIPMNKWQIWGLLLAMGYSNECIAMLRDTIGFVGPFEGLMNAGESFQLLADFPKDPQYYTFKRGYSTLPNAILAVLKDKVPIYLGTNVDSIRGQEGDLLLHLTKAPSGQSASDEPSNNHTIKVHSKQIIAAVASKGFESLYVKSPALHTTTLHNDARKLWESIGYVLGMKLTKINFYFRTAWWYDGATGRPKIEFGPNFTNLPLNSIYPFYAINDLKVDAKTDAVDIIKGEEPAALTLYCDFNNTNFWKGLQNVGPKFSSPLQEQYNQMVPQTIFPASEAVVEEARKQMGLLFGATNVPRPVFTSYRLWNGEDDFEYAYHQWKLNANDKEIIDYLANPLPGFYMCNEAISDMQGWVNGSLRSSNLALQKISNNHIQPLLSPCTKA